METAAPVKIPTALLSGLLSAAELVLNDALRLDAASLSEFKKLGNCLIKFTVTPLGDTFYLLTGYPLKLSTDQSDSPDLSIKGSPAAIVRFLRGSASASGPIITGNQEIAEKLKAIGRRLEIDWETRLAEIIGDIPAHLAGAKVREIFRTFGYIKHNFFQDAEEYLHHESKALPHSEEVRLWREAIDEITFETDELELRLQRLENMQSGATHLQKTSSRTEPS